MGLLDIIAGVGDCETRIGLRRQIEDENYKKEKSKEKTNLDSW